MDVIRKIVTDRIQNNPEVQRAYQALLARGVTAREAEVEVGRVLFACLWHAWNDPHHAPSADDAFKAIANGQSAVAAMATLGFASADAADAGTYTAANVADALEAMFEVIGVDPALLDPAPDAIVDILMQFGHVTPALLNEAAGIFRARLAARRDPSGLPGLPGGLPLK